MRQAGRGDRVRLPGLRLARRLSTLMALWLFSRKAMVAMSTMASTTGSRMKPRWVGVARCGHGAPYGLFPP